jgi:hypothetical protein
MVEVALYMLITRTNNNFKEQNLSVYTFFLNERSHFRVFLEDFFK